MKVELVLTKAILCFFVVLLSLSEASEASSPAQAIEFELVSSDWSSSALSKWNANPPSQKAVERFVHELEFSIRGDSDLGDGVSVCSFAFANFRPDGFLSLVVGLGETDSPSSCTTIYIVDKAPSGFEIRWTFGAINTGADVASSLRNLGPGRKEQLVVDMTMASIAAECDATWPAIFAWTGSNYTNVSAEFPVFYQRQLDSLNQVLARISATGVDRYDPQRAECPNAEIAAIHRFLGISSSAGIDQAIRMAGSKNNLDRQFAAEILNTINPSDSRKYLELLAGDPNPNVKFLATGSLEMLSKGQRWTPTTEFNLMSSKDRF